MLRDVSERDLTIELVGRKLPAPVLLAPVGVQGIVHPEGEIPAAKAAAALGIPLILSTLSSRNMEEVAETMGSGIRWFQLYWGKDRDIAASMVQRAEKSGYSAIVITVDTQMLGWRNRDLQRAYLPFLQGKGLANYFSDPVFCTKLSQPPATDVTAAIRAWAATFGNTKLTWEDLSWLRAQTSLPVFLKGIQHPDDAARALDYGVSGMIVSNHGGRQIDGAIPSLDALPGIVKRVGDRVPVLFDSGIRTGSDAFKALALGARAVLLGRIYVWAMAVAGEQGVRDLLQNFVAEFDLTLGLSGYRSCAELTPAALTRAE
jgi:isopentenyl diphosphate isomerase/L-lactate dehydrogenase-like FMN-dependent dehydrogenase